jgi:hypothetical protein
MYNIGILSHKKILQSKLFIEDFLYSYQANVRSQLPQSCLKNAELVILEKTTIASDEYQYKC